MNPRYNLLVAALLAGCGSNAQPAGEVVAPTNQATPGGGSVSYDSLFRVGTTWEFDGKMTRTRATMDGEAETGDGQVSEVVTGKVRCAIATVETDGTATISELKCEESDGAALDAYTLDSYFARTPAGLWLTTNRPSESSLTPESMSLASVPVPHHEEFEDPENMGGWSVSAKLSPDGNWCVAHASWAGDDSITEFCLDPARGIVSGKYGFGGGFTSDLEITLAK